MKLSLTHYIHAFKTALAALLAYAFTLGFGFEFGHWAVISTVIVMQVYVADSIELCLYRLSGTAIGASLAAAVMVFIPRTPVWVAAALFFSVALCTLLTRYRTRFRMAAITLVIVMMTASVDDNILIFAWQRVLEIAIGILCAFLVSVLVLPRKKADMLRQRMEDQADTCAALCTQLVGAFNKGQQNIEEGPVEELTDAVRKNSAFFISIRRHETRIYNLGKNFQPKVLLLARAAENLRTMARILNSHKGRGHEIILSRELLDLAQVSGKTLKALVTDDPDCPLEELDTMIRELDDKVIAIRREGLTTRFSLKRLVQIFSFYNSLKYFAQDILKEAGNITPGFTPRGIPD